MISGWKLVPIGGCTCRCLVQYISPEVSVNENGGLQESPWPWKMAGLTQYTFWDLDHLANDIYTHPFRLQIPSNNIHLICIFLRQGDSR